MADALAKLRRKTAWRRQLDALPTTRTCAGCDLCCTILKIPELGKPAWTPCWNLKGDHQGCAIWGEHPEACKTYVCLWRMSDEVLPPELFPAGCGFLLTVDNLDVWPTTVNVCADAATPDAWDTPANRALFSQLAAAWNCPVAVVGEGTLASHAFAPNGGVYSRAERPDLFPGDGASLALMACDFGPDRRPPRERIAEVQFSWRA